MEHRSTIWTVAVVVAVGGLVLYLNHEDKKDPYHLGPAAYVDGPNAASEECKKLRAEFASALERWAAEDTQADDHDTAEFERLMNSKMTDTKRQIAINSLSAKQDMAKTARENRQNNEEVSLREHMLQAGCQIPNPSH